MKKIVTLLLFLSPLAIVAQNINIKGQIKDSQNVELPFASVVLRSATDSLKLFGTIGDDNGFFTIDVPRDNYNVEISFVGIKPKLLQIDLTDKEDLVDMGIIEVSTETLLDEIVVKGNKKSVKIDLDKRVYDVSQDIVARGGTLTDVMQNLPSVQVESDGNVSIRGDQNVRILIDGKPSGLASSAELFSTIPASSIEKIEVITNPSSKYSAQGTAGIINVILKKGRKKKIASSVEVFTGHRLTGGINGNIAQSGEMGSWYANAGIGYSNPKAINDIELRSPNAIPDFSTQKSDRIRSQYYYLLNFGGDKSFNDYTSLSGSITYRGAQSDNTNTTLYEDFESDNLFRTSNREEVEDETSSFVYGNLSLDHKFNDSGHQLRISGSGELTKGDEESTIIGAETFPMELNLNQDLIRSDDEVSRIVLSTDYTLPLKNNVLLELGYRSDLSSVANDFSVERQSEGMTFVIPEFTDMAKYEEKVHAFYGQFSKTFDKLSVKLGVRTEISDIDISSENENIEDRKNYTNWFPSAFFNYSINEKHKVRLSASRRINRPGSWMILPFSTFTDERNIFVGNTDLNPSYVLATELGYTGRLSEKFGFYPTLYYRNTTDEMEFLVEKKQITIGTESHDIYASQIANIGTYTAFGADMGASYDPFNWWNMYAELGLNGFRQRGSVRGASFDGDGLLVSGRYNVTFVLPKSIRFQVQSFYRGPIETGQYRRKGFYGINFGLSSKAFNGNGSIDLNVRDLFNSNKRLVTTFGSDFTRDLELQYRVRQITLSLNYRFNQKKYKGKKGSQYDSFEIVN